MKTKRRTTVLIMLLMGADFSVLIGNQAKACSCSPITVKELYALSDVIFQGEVIEFQAIDCEWPGGSYSEVVFRVLRSWKGIDDPEVTAYTGGPCGFFPIEVGDEFLIYAGGDLCFDIAFHDCNSQRLSDGRSDDISILNSIAEPTICVDESELYRPHSRRALCGNSGLFGAPAAIALLAFTKNRCPSWRSH